MKTVITIILILFLFLGAAGQSGWNPDLMIKLNRVGGTDVSPNGSLVAYTISSPVMEGEKSEFLTHIWLASADGSSNFQFTQGDKSCTNPRFSSDGKYLAFLSSRKNEGKIQVWIIRVGGGEAEQLTRSKTGIEQFAWSPDGHRIAFTQRDADTEQEEKDKKEKRDWTLVDTWKYAHLYTLGIEKTYRGERKLQRLTGGAFHITNFDWSPDGKTIAFAHQANPSLDLWTTSDISTVPSDSGTVKGLVKLGGMDTYPLYSPDGYTIAFISDGGIPKWAGTSDIYLVPSVGGTLRKLADTPDRQAALVKWSADGREIYFGETSRTCYRLFAEPVNGDTPRIVTTGVGNFTGVSFSKDDKILALIYQKTETSPEVYTSSSARFDPLRVSDANPDFPKLPMGKTEVIHWNSKDGRDIEGLLTYPVNYQVGRKYPLILNIHGGPAGVFTQNFTGAGSVYPIQAFAQDGYAVLRPNPRGSAGYGREFRHANYNDWGYGDYEDDQAGVDKAISLGIAHPDSLVICGWSYGGYMTSFTITRTNRYKAASVGAGVTNLMSFVGTADIPGFLPDYFGGEYWSRMEIFMKHSPMFHIKNVKTPAQVIHGERDLRVPPSQGFEFYTALKRLNVPTEMITYPRTPHGVQEPKFIQDIGNRTIAWFDKYLRKK